MKTLIRSTWFLDEIPLLCKTIKDRAMAKATNHHDLVELVGGPMDGKQFREDMGSVKVSHNTSEVYQFGDASYSPWKVVQENGQNILRMKYNGKAKYTGEKAKA